jgi:DNA-binding transcriptional regulator YiaG
VKAHRALPAPPERRALRESAGASLTDVARVVGVTKTTVAGWETGEFDPRGQHLTTYVEVLQIFEAA